MGAIGANVGGGGVGSGVAGAVVIGAVVGGAVVGSEVEGASSVGTGVGGAAVSSGVEGATVIGTVGGDVNEELLVTADGCRTTRTTTSTTRPHAHKIPPNVIHRRWYHFSGVRCWASATNTVPSSYPSKKESARGLKR